MRKYYGLALAAGLLVGTPTPAAAWPRNPAETLAVLPAGASAPEGLTVGADGNLYVTTFGYDAAGEVAGPGHLYVFTPDGQLIRDVAIQGSTSHQLGIAFNPATSELLAIDAGAGVVRRVDPQNGAASVFMTAGAGALLNGIAFDPAGNAYVTDSANGIVWTVGPQGGAGRIWVQDPLLTTTGVPTFGANGIGFNHDYTAAFVANTGNDTILRIPVANRQAGQAAVFVNSINGADGLVLDAQDNLLGRRQPGRRDRRGRYHGQGDRQARRLQGCAGRRAARPAVPGEPGIQRRRAVYLRDQPRPRPARRRRRAVGGLAIRGAGPPLHGLAHLDAAAAVAGRGA